MNKNETHISRVSFLSITKVGLLATLLFASSSVLGDSLGPNNPSVAFNDSSNGKSASWTSTSNVLTVDGNRSDVFLNKPEISQFLKSTGYGFSIPNGVTITGIQVNVTRESAASGTVHDEALSLVASGATSTSLADTSTFWPTSLTAKTYGSATTTWGRTWTSAEINSSSFGVIISANNIDTSQKHHAYVDGITISVTYTKLDQTITVTSSAPGSAAYSSSFSVSATSTSGLAVAITSSGSCSGSGTSSTTITMTSGIGSCNVNFNQSGNSTYNSAATTTQSVTASKASQSIIFTGLSAKTYGDADFSVLATATSGLEVAFTASDDVCSVSGSTVHIIGNGTCTITAHQSGNDNFYSASDVPQSFSINKKAIAVTADNKSKIFSGTDPVLTYQVTGSLVGSDNFSGSIIRAVGEDVGKYDITQGTLSLSDNYTLTFTPGVFTIGELVIDVNAGNKSKVYGQSDPELTYSSTPALRDGDAFSGSLARDLGENVGTYAITQSTLALNSNYSINYTGATFTINKADQTLDFGALSDGVYGEAPFEVSASSTSGLLATFSATGTCSVAGSTVSILGAGSCSITSSQAGSNNFNPAADIIRSFNIGKATTTVVLSNLSQTFDGNPKSVDIITIPAGLNVVVTYNESTTAPIGIGSYNVTATVDDLNYSGSVSDVLNIVAPVVPPPPVEPVDNSTSSPSSIESTVNPLGASSNGPVVVSNPVVVLPPVTIPVNPPPVRPFVAQVLRRAQNNFRPSTLLTGNINRNVTAIRSVVASTTNLIATATSSPRIQNTASVFTSIGDRFNALGKFFKQLFGRIF